MGDHCPTRRRYRAGKLCIGCGASLGNRRQALCFRCARLQAEAQARYRKRLKQLARAERKRLKKQEAKP